jgi:hypothetical protein
MELDGTCMKLETGVVSRKLGYRDGLVRFPRKQQVLVSLRNRPEFSRTHCGLWGGDVVIESHTQLNEGMRKFAW